MYLVRYRGEPRPFPWMRLSAARESHRAATLWRHLQEKDESQVPNLSFCRRPLVSRSLLFAALKRRKDGCRAQGAAVLHHRAVSVDLQVVVKFFVHDGSRVELLQSALWRSSFCADVWDIHAHFDLFRAWSGLTGNVRGRVLA